MLGLNQIEYIALNVASVERSCRFYSEKLGIEIIPSEGNCKFLNTGLQKIRLKQLGTNYEHNPRNNYPGSAEICFHTKIPLKEIEQILIKKDVVILSKEETILQSIQSKTALCIKDPDGNLLIITNAS